MVPRRDYALLPDLGFKVWVLGFGFWVLGFGVYLST